MNHVLQHIFINVFIIVSNLLARSNNLEIKDPPLADLLVCAQFSRVKLHTPSKARDEDAFNY